MNKLKLYSYWRSSTSYRVRIALALKKLSYEIIPVHLVKDGGGQHDTAYKRLNPMASVPTLVDGDFTLTQSGAILEYLEEKYPSPPLLPENTQHRAYIRQIMNLISCDIHPLNNLRVLQTLSNDLKINEAEKKIWYHKWINNGFEALETMIGNSRFYGEGSFCGGASPTFADCCLIPQIYNARRFDIDMARFETLTNIEAQCLDLEAFQNAHPDRQPDAERPE